jgi:hypothetical protein
LQHIHPALTVCNQVQFKSFPGSLSKIFKTPSGFNTCSIRLVLGSQGKSQAVPDKFVFSSIFPAVPVESKLSENRKGGHPESGEKILIDLNRATHLGWTHYRILSGIKDNIKRNFYFEQASHER